MAAALAPPKQAISSGPLATSSTLTVPDEQAGSGDGAVRAHQHQAGACSSQGSGWRQRWSRAAGAATAHQRNAALQHPPPCKQLAPAHPSPPRPWWETHRPMCWARGCQTCGAGRTRVVCGAAARGSETRKGGALPPAAVGLFWQRLTCQTAPRSAAHYIRSWAACRCRAAPPEGVWVSGRGAGLSTGAPRCTTNACARAPPRPRSSAPAAP